MILLQSPSEVSASAQEEFVAGLRDLLQSGSRVVLLPKDGPDDALPGAVLESLPNDSPEAKGQCILLEAKDLQDLSLPSVLAAALDGLRTGRPFQIHLPQILQDNPRTRSPFINRAILWQRLCDRIIEDENPCRETLLVVENVDQADDRLRHDLARLIRFHRNFQIRRTFVLTFQRENLERLGPELKALAG